MFSFLILQTNSFKITRYIKGNFSVECSRINDLNKIQKKYYNLSIKSQNWKNTFFLAQLTETNENPSTTSNRYIKFHDEYDFWFSIYQDSELKVPVIQNVSFIKRGLYFTSFGNINPFVQYKSIIFANNVASLELMYKKSRNEEKNNSITQIIIARDLESFKKEQTWWDWLLDQPWLMFVPVVCVILYHVILKPFLDSKLKSMDNKEEKENPSSEHVKSSKRSQKKLSSKTDANSKAKKD